MNIYGLQKLTLLDYPKKVACTVFTGGCNFRCPFCHNSSLILCNEIGDAIDEADFFSFLKKRVGILDGVCVSGGEPLLQPDIKLFLTKIKSMGFLIKLDTNGSFPERLKELVQSGLVDYVAMDIKNSPERYAETIDVPNYDISDVEKSVTFLLMNTVDYEFRTTVVRELHSAADFVSIGVWLKSASQYYLQAFEDSPNVLKKGLSGYSKLEMEGFLKILYHDIPFAALRGI